MSVRTAEIVGNTALLQTGERTEMRLCQVVHMNIVTHAGPVGCGVVIAEYLQGRTPAQRRINSEGNQMGFWTMVLTQAALGLTAGGVEVAQRGIAQALGLRGPVERTLQHVPDPGLVLAEMGRTTRPGGAVLAVEPDWGTFVVDSNFENVSRRLAQFWCDSFRCGWIGRRLGRFMAEAGLVGVEIVPLSLVLRHLEAAEAVYSLLETADRAVADGAVSLAEATAFAAEQRQRDAEGTFFSSLTFFMAVGYKP